MRTVARAPRRKPEAQAEPAGPAVPLTEALVTMVAQAEMQAQTVQTVERLAAAAVRTVVALPVAEAQDVRVHRAGPAARRATAQMRMAVAVTALALLTATLLPALQAVAAHRPAAPAGRVATVPEHLERQALAALAVRLALLQPEQVAQPV